MSNIDSIRFNTRGLLGNILRILGVVAIILGFVCAANFTKEDAGLYYHRTNHALVLFYIAGGVFTSVFNFALAAVTDYCEKHLDD